MARTDRYLTGKVYGMTTEADASGGKKKTRALLIAEYECFAFRASLSDADQIRRDEGLQTDAAIWKITGEYNALVTRDQTVEDANGLQFRILSAQPVYGSDPETPEAMALVGVKL